MVDDVSRRGVLLGTGAALTGSMVTGIGSKRVVAATDDQRDVARGDAPPVRWHEPVSYGGYERPATVLSEEDGSVRVGGFGGVAYDAVHPWSVTVDRATGDVGDNTVAEIDGRFLTQGVAQLPSGDQVFAGRYTEEPDDDDSSREPMLVRTNEDGELVWQRTYEPPFDYFYTSGIVPGVDGGAVFIGYSMETSNAYTWLVAVDADGSIRWEQEIDDHFATWGFGIQQTSDENYLLHGGAHRGSEREYEGLSGWATLLDSQGSQLWSQRYEQRSDGDESRYHYLEDVTETDDGYLFVGYVAPEGDDPAGRGWVVSTDDEGKRLYSSLRQPEEGASGVFRSVVPLENGYGLVGTAVIGEYDERKYAWIRSVDATLSGNWETVDPLDQRAKIRVARATNDGGFVLAGNHETDSGLSDAFVAKVGGDPVETPTPSPTASPTPTPTATASPTPTPTPTSSAPDTETATAERAETAKPTAADDAGATTAGDGPGFGVTAALAALGSGAWLSRSRLGGNSED